MVVGSPAAGSAPARRKASHTKGEARREQVITAAARLFREKGFHATSMQDIADEVGLRKGSLYYHVSSKDDLLFQIVDRGVTSALNELEDICASNIPPTEKLRKAVHSLVGALANQPERITIFLQELRSLRSQQVEIIAQKRKRYELLFREIMEEGARQGLFHLADRKVAAFGLLGMCNWIHRWYREGAGMSPDQIGQTFSEIFLWGCLDNKSRRPRRRRHAREVQERVSN